MITYPIPKSYWAQLDIDLQPMMPTVDAVLVRVTKKNGPIVHFELRHTDAGIPSKVIFLDGALWTDGIPLQNWVVRPGNPNGADNGIFNVSSGYLTIIPLENWEGHWRSTNRIFAVVGLDSKLELHYEDTPVSSGKTPGSERNDIELTVTGVEALPSATDLEALATVFNP